ncbi:hypothetical protein [Deinococcus daejeonensis]|uniref:Transposase n=1 Tax=Deinococcus daejeonensis TaxID=1007098 RepID=A0ABQ2JE67_9DEIO|nr:hypothetical protein [Deinococcus daejeonensis]GGN44132.1 hypothetical protein GCM10010842_32330 [Deinococcus daejeonensis]
MNTAQALAQLFPTLVPTRDIHEARPTPLPADAFWAVSELADAARRDFYPEPGGIKPQERTLTLLITLYGKEGWTLSDLRPFWQAARANLANLVTEHPGYPPLRGVTRGAVLPPTPDSDTRRPLAAVRLICTYLE